MRWRLEATFDATELEADGIGDAVMALVPLEADISMIEVDEDGDPMPSEHDKALYYAEFGILS